MINYVRLEFCAFRAGGIVTLLASAKLPAQNDERRTVMEVAPMVTPFQPASAIPFFCLKI